MTDRTTGRATSRSAVKIDWIVSPDLLGAFDASVVHCIAGEFDEAFLDRVTKTSGLDTRQRMADMVLKHFHLTLGGLYALPRAQRQQLAMDIVVAETEERQTMPGQLVELRTLGGT